MMSAFTFLRALDSGISIIMEVGLDPGIDHMLAMECFKDIKDRGGEVRFVVGNLTVFRIANPFLIRSTRQPIRSKWKERLLKR